MNNSECSWLQNILYEEDMDIVKKEVQKMNNSILIHIYVGNYNWDNGFDIPNIIINNKNCDLATALLLFYCADGYRMLEDGERAILNSSKWGVFLINLYNKIINNSFILQGIAFDPPLTKMQILKLKKKRSDIPSIFLDSLRGEKVEIVKL